ncbi:unnamed protein product [Anisakis simplex]|uniref:Microspherule protein 1 (inferred by orthology to a human protein) n=1 Tax=Anisakis simplex TaxID=6269 RepID=A0A158PP06_ANISI|nr:unnamed protein product [Anisakis simplex]
MDTSTNQSSVITPPNAAAPSTSNYKESAYEGTQKVRRSLREIKKPKFDDEIVDSAVTQKTITRKRVAIERMHHSPDNSEINAERNENGYSLSKICIRKRPRLIDISGTSSSSVSEEKQQQPQQSKKSVILSQLPSPVLVDKVTDLIFWLQKRRERIASKEARTKELANAASQNTAASANVLESLKKWTATDDLQLVVAVQHTCSLQAVRIHVNFSRPFTLSEIEERWYELLYDEAVSSIARKRMYDLPAETIRSIQSRTVFNIREHQILFRIPSTAPNQISTFEQVLKEHSKSFHHARTAEVLLEHWRKMKSWHLLIDQNGVTSANEKEASALFYMERNKDINLAGDWQLSVNEARSSSGLSRTDRDTVTSTNHWGEIVTSRWPPSPRVNVEAVSGVWNEAQMGEGVWAVLKGRLMRYAIRGKRVLIGRNTAKHEVDVNLKLEGPAARISRKQALLKCHTDESTGSVQCFINNVGKRPIFVDGKTVLEGSKARVFNNSVIEVANIRLVFVVNSNPITQTDAATAANHNNSYHIDNNNCSTIASVAPSNTVVTTDQQ